MKEVPYNSNLDKDIAKSKLKGNFWKAFLNLVALGVIGGLTIIGGYHLLQMNLVNVGIFAGGFVLFSATIVGIVTKHINYKRKASRDNLSNLKSDLQIDGINISVVDIQKSLVTEEKRELVQTNRKGQSQTNEEIIKRYFMLDSNKQIQVLQQTLSKCKEANGNVMEMTSLQLMEDKDLKYIEIPEVVVKKSLKFNDIKK